MSTTENLGITLINSSDYVDPEAINEGFRKADQMGVDYIVEEGTSGNWFFRKWKNGKAECWYQGDEAINATSAYSGNYYGYVKLKFPFAFTSSPMTFASTSAPHHLITVAQNNTSTLGAEVCVVSLGIDYTGTNSFFLYAVGNYK